MGADAALKGHRASSACYPVITEEAKAWVVHLACSKPKEHVVTRPNYGREVRWLCMFANMRSK